MVKFDGDKNENRLSRGRRFADSVVRYRERKEKLHSESTDGRFKLILRCNIRGMKNVFGILFRRSKSISMHRLGALSSNSLERWNFWFEFFLLRRQINFWGGGRNIPIFINRIASGCMRREEAEFPFKFVSSSRAFRSESDLKDLNSFLPPPSPYFRAVMEALSARLSFRVHDCAFNWNLKFIFSRTANGMSQRGAWKKGSENISIFIFLIKCSCQFLGKEPEIYSQTFTGNELHFQLNLNVYGSSPFRGGELFGGGRARLTGSRVAKPSLRRNLLAKAFER